MEARGQPRDGLRRFRIGRKDFWIILADHQSVLHVLHLYVAKEQMAHIVTAIAIGLNANAIVRALEVNALGTNVLHAARNLTADREAMSVQEGAIGNRNIAARRIRPRRVDCA